jgi:DMSO reductase anchor subunit
MEQEPNRPPYVFLVLTPAAVGCLLGSLILDGSFNVRPYDIGAVTIALVFALAAALAPILRLRRPFRAYRMLRGGRSPLTSQAMAFGIFLLFLVVCWALILAAHPVLWLGVVTVVLGFVTLGFIAQVYLLASRPGWRHWSTPVSLLGTLLSLGLATSLLVALHWTGLLLGKRAAPYSVKSLVLFGIILLLVAGYFRIAHLQRATAGTRSAAALLRDRYYAWLTLGLVLEIGIAGIAIVLSFPYEWVIGIAWVALLVGSFIDRWLFYITAAPRTFRDELSGVSRA